MSDREITVRIVRLGFMRWGYEFQNSGHDTRGVAMTRRGAMSAARVKVWWLWGKIPEFIEEDAR